jgi:hypothetical protein
MKCLLFFLVTTFCFSLSGQQRIFATISGGDLYRFDIVNCTRTFIGSTGYGFGDIAFTPNGRLWGIYTGLLYEIDTATAAATYVGNTGIGGVTLVDLNDTTLLMENSCKLYGINTNTGTSWYIDTIGYSASGDLTWYDDALYLSTPLVRVKLNSTFTAITSVNFISGSIPSCEGAVAAIIPGDYNSLIGFSGPDLLKICHIDGTYTTLCPALNINGTPGAAAIRLPNQVPQPVVCSVSNGINESFNIDNAFDVFPNPASIKINIHSVSGLEFNYGLYNSFGQLIKSGVFKNSPTELYLNDISNGLYIIELHDKITTEQHRFIVNR